LPDDPADRAPGQVPHHLNNVLNQPQQVGHGAQPHDHSNLSTPSVWRSARSHAAAKVEALSSNGMDEIEIPAFLRKQAD
jgi:cell division protein FtsZ